MFKPVFDFMCEIHPKPRGNWRPRVDLKITIRKEDHPWRPYLQGLYIISECLYCTICKYNDRLLLPSNLSEIKFFIYIPSNLDTSLDSKGIFFKHPERYNNEMRGIWLNRCCENERYYYFDIIPPQYLDKDINMNFSFYLPWKSEKNPNYSEYVQYFIQIPSLIEKMLLEGIDSGESSRIIITKEEVQNFAETNNNKKISKIRKLIL